MSKKKKSKGMAKAQAKKHNPKLELWQERLDIANREFSGQVKRMDERELIYNGEKKLKPLVEGDTENRTGTGKTSHVRNIVFENVESMVSSSIPAPKVTPRRRTSSSGTSAMSWTGFPLRP